MRPDKVKLKTEDLRQLLQGQWWWLILGFDVTTFINIGANADETSDTSDNENDNAIVCI